MGFRGHFVSCTRACVLTTSGETQHKHACLLCPMPPCLHGPESTSRISVFARCCWVTNCVTFQDVIWRLHKDSVSSSARDFPGGSEGKAPAHNARDLGSIPGSESSPGEGNGNPLQYPCLENPMDGRTWWATVHGVAKSRTRLSELTSLQSVNKGLSKK